MTESVFIKLACLNNNADNPNCTKKTPKQNKQCRFTASKETIGGKMIKK